MKTTPNHIDRLPVSCLQIAVVWSQRILTLVMCLAILLLILTPLGSAYAQGPAPEDPVNGAAGTLVRILSSLGMLFIKAAYALMFIVFAVGSVKNGVGAILAQQFGVADRLSREILNFAFGAVIFVVALMSMPLVNLVVSKVTEELILNGGWNFDIYIPAPLPGS